MNREILVGDVLEKIKEIPDKTIDCVITSPPYWSLRDYSVEGQWGLEPDFHQYLAKMGRLMDELRRVLKDTGTCWINLGDTYGGSGKGAGTADCKESWRPDKRPKMNETITAKSRVGIPERFYIRCIDAGWVARNHIPWIKANCMPSSVQDRFTNKWESVFFFAKERKYFFNLDAVREEPLSGYGSKVAKKKKGGIRKGLANMQQNNLRTYALHEKREKGIPVNNCNPKGKNPGDVFHINTRPCKEAHFATFPPELPEKILKCSCPPNGTVLDPFFGAGTVGLVAEKLNLNWVGIELNPEYAEIAKKRIGCQQKLI